MTYETLVSCGLRIGMSQRCFETGGFREMNGHSIVTVVVGRATKNDPELLG